MEAWELFALNVGVSFAGYMVGSAIGKWLKTRMRAKQ